MPLAELLRACPLRKPRLRDFPATPLSWTPFSGPEVLRRHLTVGLPKCGASIPQGKKPCNRRGAATRLIKVFVALRLLNFVMHVVNERCPRVTECSINNRERCSCTCTWMLRISVFLTLRSRAQRTIPRVGLHAAARWSTGVEAAIFGMGWIVA